MALMFRWHAASPSPVGLDIRNTFWQGYSSWL